MSYRRRGGGRGGYGGGYGYEDNFYEGGFGYGGDQGYGRNQGYGGSGQWSSGNEGNRKRRNNFDQLQQYEQGDNQWGDYSQSWGGNSYENSYDDAWYGGGGDGNYQGQGTSQWSRQDDYIYDDYDDGGFSNSRKRGRYRDGPGQQFGRRRDPFSVNFYDDYEESYDRRNNYSRRQPRNRQSFDRQRSDEFQHDRREGARKSDGLRSLAPNYRRKPSDAKKVRGGRVEERKKSPEEEAIYTKHREITVEKDKRDHIGDTMRSLLSSISKIAVILATENQPKANDDEKILQEEEKCDEKEEKISNSTGQDDTEKMEVASAKEDETKSEENNDNSTESTEEQKDDTSVNGNEKASETVTVEPEVKKPSKPVPVLVGAIKCGESAMRILVGNNLQGQLVVLSKKKPTRSLVERVRELFILTFLEDRRMKDEQYSLEIDDEREYMVLKQESIPNFQVIIRFTSPMCSPEFEKSPEDENEEDPLDVLSPENCKEALTMLRRLRFFVKILDHSAVALTVIRILLYLRSLEHWQKLSVWLSLVLVHYAIETSKKDYHNFEKKGDFIKVDRVFIRCMEMLSGGILLSKGAGVKDPCEIDVDVVADFSPQEAEDMTRAAQEVLRASKFGKLPQVLGLPEKEKKEENREKNAEEKSEEKKEEDKDAEIEEKGGISMNPDS